MGFMKNLKVLYDAHMKQVRDRNAEDAYVYEQGVAAGEAKGHAFAENRMQALIVKMTEAGEADKLSRLSDKSFLEEMYRKYQI